MYKALRDIDAGEELCINYGTLWFQDADQRAMAVEQPEEEDEILKNIQIDL